MTRPGRSVRATRRRSKLLTVFVLVCLGLALGPGFRYFTGERLDPDDVRTLATRGLADFLAGQFPGSHVLVLANPFAEKPGASSSVVDQERSGIEGVRLGLGAGLVLDAVVYPALKPEAAADPAGQIGDVSVTTPLSFMLQDDALEQVASAHPETDLWISLIGLPMNVRQTAVWQAAGSPRFALLFPDLRMLGASDQVRAEIMRGKLAAFVVARPSAQHLGTPSSADWKDQFNRRFWIIHAGNFDEAVRTNPQWFPSP